ncbi:MAG: alpha/beta hydrolase [Candidatus Aminicenantes bacterium]|nr:MAG: alpha/beta hydrolase [Candidatus Aminicenantes bacterium]
MAKRVNSRKSILAIVFIGIIALWLQTIPSPSSAGNKLRQSAVKVYSQILEEERTILVSLPDGYESAEKSYPVLYILDAEGETLFPKCISTVMDLNKKDLAPEMIVVGIWNTDRNRDMIPEAVSHRPGSGGSKNFLNFIKQELMPYIQKNYHASDYSMLFGMSNSALFAVYALLEKPTTFKAYIASSPMIGHCPDYMHNKAEAFIEKNHLNGKLLYMIYGSEDSHRVTAYVPNFQNYLNSHAPEGFSSKLEILDGEGHVPDGSLFRGLQFIFNH